MYTVIRHDFADIGCKLPTIQQVLCARPKFLRHLRVSTAFANISTELMFSSNNLLIF